MRTEGFQPGVSGNHKHIWASPAGLNLFLQSRDYRVFHDDEQAQSVHVGLIPATPEMRTDDGLYRINTAGVPLGHLETALTRLHQQCWVNVKKGAEGPQGHRGGPPWGLGQ